LPRISRPYSVPIPRRPKIAGHDVPGKRRPGVIFRVNVCGLSSYGRSTLCRLRWSIFICACLPLASPLAQSLWLSGLDVIARARIPPVLPVAAGARIAPAVAEMLRLFTGAGARIEAIAGIQELGFRVLRVAMEYADVKDVAVPVPALARLEPALARIRQDPTKHVSCTELAALVSLSPARFHSLFKETVGVAPKVYMRSLQLRRACELLTQTELSVKAIATQCGFGSAFYLCRQFRRHLGQTPRAFRTALARPAP